MDKAKNVKKLPNTGNHNCFGCSPNNPSGLRMEIYAGESAVFSWIKVPEHLSGWNHRVHGGVISTILDEIMGWAAIYLLKKFVLTKSMTVEFIKPVFIGSRLQAEGKVLGFKEKREVSMGGFIYDEAGELCARSNGTFPLLSPALAKRLGVVDDDLLKSFKPLMD